MIALIIIMSSVIIGLANGVGTSEYGYFNSKILGIKTCQGPKRKDCCITTVEMLEENVAHFDIQVPENFLPTKAKIVASFKGKQLVRLPVNKICDHFFITPLITTLLNTTDNCVIQKDHYKINLDLAEVFKKYYHGMFLYGNWTFRSTFWSNDCNFMCLLTDINLYPKE